jgi:hypothetical protein
MGWTNQVNSLSFRNLFQTRIKTFLAQVGYPFSIITSTFETEPSHLEDEINYFTSQDSLEPYPYELNKLSNTISTEVKPLTKEAYHRLCCIYEAMNHIPDLYYNRDRINTTEAYKDPIKVRSYKMNSFYLIYIVYILFIIIFIYSVLHISLNSILLCFFSLLILLFSIFI